MCKAVVYEIRIREVLDKKWAAYFAPFEVTTGVDETILTGLAQDQAELFGLLLKISELGLKLVSINPAPAQSRPAAE
jgi:hypothetical protein